MIEELVPTTIPRERILLLAWHHHLSSLFCLKCTLYSVHPSIYLQFLFAYNGPTNQNNQLWLGGSKLLWFFICIISCFVVEKKYEMKYEHIDVIRFMWLSHIFSYFRKPLGSTLCIWKSQSTEFRHFRGSTEFAIQNLRQIG